jgi:hypothetical protein
MRDVQKLFAIGALALLLPFAAPGEDAATANEGTKVDAATANEEAAVEVASGQITHASRDGLQLRRMDGGGSKRVLTLGGGMHVPVGGEKESWLELRRSDFVTVAWDPETRQLKKVIVHPPEANPRVAAAMGKVGKMERSFTGFVKLRNDTQLVLRKPDSANGKRKGSRMTFVRGEETTVGMFRSAWDEIRKGDRVTVEYGKGRPRPALRVNVVYRSGEKPLPPGLATRIFDPKYDRTVKDVDGIGEVPPGTEWKPAAGQDETPRES